MTAVEIRSATEADALGIKRTIRAAYAEAAGRIADLPAVDEGVTEHIRADVVHIAIDQQGRVAGVLILTPQSDCLKLTNVAVHPRSRGIGLGRRLLDLATAEARARGFDLLRLATHASLHDTIALYRHLGWTETGRDGNRVFMEKPAH